MKKAREIASNIMRLITVAVLLTVFSLMPASNPASAQGGEVPDFMQEFIIFFTSGNLGEMSRYIHPDRGFIQDGYILTYEEVEKDFMGLAPEIKKADFIKLYFNEGFFPADNYYRAKCTVEYRTQGYTQQVPTVFVFEQIGGKWYLVQSERVEFIENYRSRDILTVGYILNEIELQTNTGRMYNSGAAAEKNKVTLLYFFNLLDIFREENTAFYLGLLEEFGSRKDMYVLGVSDENKTYIENWMDDEKVQFVWLYDENSLVHYDLGILIHPMIILLDRDSRVVMMGGWNYDRNRLREQGYYPPAEDLIKKRIKEVLLQPAS
jgi:peroxiredoxin